MARPKRAKSKRPPPKPRRVEYFRLWQGNGIDTGDWDTAFLEISRNTPNDKLDAAVRQAAKNLKWRDDKPPILVGYYCEADDEE